MKRFIYTTIALAAVAVGCTKSNIVDVPEVQKTPITFETYNGKTPVTKATDVTQATFEASTQEAPAFNVKAFKPNGEGYMDEPVWYVPAVEDNPDTEGTDETMAAYWDYDGLTYWPSDGSSLTFAAYGLNAASNVSLSSDGKTLTYTVPANASSHADLVVATPVTQAATEGGTVRLEFKHVLSRVGFRLTTIGSGTSVKINNVILNGLFKNKGTVALNAGTTITPTDETTLSYSLFAEGEGPFETDGTTALTEAPIYSGTEDNRYMMIIPGEVQDNAWDDTITSKVGNDPYIYVDYELGGEKRQAYIPLLDTVIADDNSESKVNWNFVAGKAYEFIFEVSISQIKFTGVVEDWDEDHTDNTTDMNDMK